MVDAPALHILAVIEDLDAFAGFMTSALGAPDPLRIRHGAQLHADLFRLSSGYLLAMQPLRPDSFPARYLAERGPGFMAFGMSGQGAPGVSGRALCADGPLSGIMLADLPRTGIQIATHCGAVEAPDSGRGGPLGLDHIAYVVGNLDDAVQEAGAALGVNEHAAVGRWRFPQFQTTNALLLFDRAYVEFNQPATSEGLFGSLYAKHKAGSVLVCLRCADVSTCRDRLAQQGVALGEPMEITALRAGAKMPELLGTVYAIPRRAAQGLRIMIFDTSWPWSRLNSQGRLPDSLAGDAA